MNFVDFVFYCYTHITSHVSQTFTSCTYYTSYSLLNIVHVIVCVFGLTNQVCKYFVFLCKTNLMLENLWKMFDDLNFGKTGFKTLFLKYISSHTHAFCSSISMLWGVSKMCLWIFQNCVFSQNFVGLCLFWLIQYIFRSIESVLKLFKEAFVWFNWSKLILDQSKLFWNCLKNFKEPSVCFDQSKIVDQVFKKSEFDIFKLTFQKGFQTFSLSPTWTRLAHNFLSFSSGFFARFSSL